MNKETDDIQMGRQKRSRYKAMETAPERERGDKARSQLAFDPHHGNIGMHADKYTDQAAPLCMSAPI